MAGRNPPQPGQGHTPLDVIYDGRRLRVRVAEFVDLTDAHLWRQRQSAAYLLSQLRDGLRAIGDAGLAHDLVAGRLAAAPPDPPKIAGFSPEQRQAYASCMAPGVRLVWGPPGTGKTWVLSEAVSDLAAAGKRVLLVSATNVAVDNALLGVLRHHKHRPGELVRVGAPHLRAIAADPQVSLTHLVRSRLTEVEHRRDNLAQQLLALRRRSDDLIAAEATLAGFDPAEHIRLRTLITTTDEIPHLTAVLDQVNREHRACQVALARADELIATAEAAVADTADTVHALGLIADLNRDWTTAQAAVDQIGMTAMTARAEADRLTAELRAAMAGTRLQRWRNRSTITALETSAQNQRNLAEEAERRDRQNRQLLDRVRISTDHQIAELRPRVRYTDEQISQRHAALARARAYRRTIAGQKAGLDQRLRAAQTELNAAEATPRPTAVERASVERADRDDLPRRHEQLLIMRAETATAETGRQHLEQQYADVQDEFDRLRRDAESELIKHATVVATTLARMRTSKTLLDGPYDAVLIDEVGAATLPEVLLAVSRARTTAVLLGDFLQLGAVITGPITKSKDPDVRRWLFRDVFALTGITVAADARAHPGCTTLDIQHRFGPQIMSLANTIAYDGQLTAGDEIRDHDPDDPEIVLIDTDGIDDLAEVRPTGPRTGWWPIGVLIARVLADYHRGQGEDIGVITPYKHQAEATLEAFRDREHGDNNPTDVGTAHRFQGRQFDIVVFDLVEDGNPPRWMAAAGPYNGAFGRAGMRLFTVAVTRTKHRLYLIGSRNLIIDAAPDTALAAIAALGTTVRTVPARLLLGLPPDPRDTRRQTSLGAVGQDLADILAQHVRITAIQDERQFYETFAGYLQSAQHSLWIWAAWTTNRLKKILPAIADAASRGVKTVVFVRDPSDQTQGTPASQQHVTALRTVVPATVEVFKLHQKIIVIDERIVLFGSLNALSQSNSREVMLVMEGEHFARKLLDHEQARAIAVPPRCVACGSTALVLHRTVRQDWFWRCYAPTGAIGPKGRPARCRQETPLKPDRGTRR